MVASEPSETAHESVSKSIQGTEGEQGDGGEGGPPGVIL